MMRQLYLRLLPIALYSYQFSSVSNLISKPMTFATNFWDKNN
jgi:hypothetical protein